MVIIDRPHNIDNSDDCYQSFSSDCNYFTYHTDRREDSRSLAPSLTHSLTNLLAPFGGSNRGKLKAKGIWNGMGQQSNNDLKKCVNQFIIFLLSRFVSCAGHNNLICTQVTLNSLSITIIRLLLLLLLHSLSFGTNRNCPRGHHTQFIVD